MSWRRNVDDRSGIALEEREAELPPEDAVPTLAPEGRSMPLWRKLGVVSVFVVLVGGLAWTFTSDDDPKPVTPAAPPSTTTAEPATPEIAQPQLRNTGEDFNEIVRSASSFEDWVYQHDPDPKYLSLIKHPKCACYKVAEDGLASLKAANQHHDSPGVRIHEVILRDRPRPELVTLYVLFEGLPGAIVDGQGNSVKERPRLPTTGFLEDWVRGEDGRWRKYSFTVLGPPGEGSER